MSILRKNPNAQKSYPDVFITFSSIKITRYKVDCYYTFLWTIKPVLPPQSPPRVTSTEAFTPCRLSWVTEEFKWNRRYTNTSSSPLPKIRSQPGWRSTGAIKSGINPSSSSKSIELPTEPRHSSAYKQFELRRGWGGLRGGVCFSQQWHRTSFGK